MPASEAETCWLCDRPLGRKVQQHHTVPKAKKGRETVPMHPICHRTIHKTFSNAELSRFGSDHARLISDERIARFIDWVSAKPPDFHAPTR